MARKPRTTAERVVDQGNFDGFCAYLNSLLDPHEFESTRRTMFFRVAETDAAEAGGSLMDRFGLPHQDDIRDRILMEAVRHDCVGFLHVLASRGVELDGRLYGCPGTLLHRAVYKNALRSLDTLLALGVEVDSNQARDGVTPLHVAVWKDAVPAAERLLAYGADAFRKNLLGYNAFDYGREAEAWCALETLQRFTETAQPSASESDASPDASRRPVFGTPF